ncbi:hypothetical protein ASG47_07065 [Devosia sp. Leaf420]|uniref:hypothetical protein n=1 Tax=Devosia sp. Leaf420 TaxID=1736374 RepID=UPI0007124C4C|nr:hypothetical protein [Devosia sp. Leaf420]KQT48128.1 hypothetical protein ASG47_07065 [Devosia sp. Leaf420]
MSEAKSKSRKREEILKDEPRCIYCALPPVTLEHMPPRIMFKDKQRPSGLEFACCDACNRNTSAADSVASYMAKLDRQAWEGDWRLQAATAQQGLLKAIAPGFLEELYDPNSMERVYLPTSGGVRIAHDVITANGPLIRSYLSVFGAKFGMSLYREYVGRALPMEGAVLVTWSLNVGFQRKFVDQFMQIMPGLDRLSQGTKTSQGQFDYRYNTDRKSLVAAYASFHTGLNILALATSTPERLQVDALRRGAIVRPGTLVSLMPDTGRPSSPNEA